MNVFQLSALLLTLTALAPAHALELQSGSRQNALVELFTSEGCSSCPPAEAWLSRFRTDKRLWKEIVPVAFHVDYWDGLGWPDRFASPGFTERQRKRAAAGSRSPYTPEIDVNGAEWRGYGNRAVPSPDRTVGKLKARTEGDKISIEFSPEQPFTGGRAYAVWLGMDLATDVKRGENAGRVLKHNFVALSWSAADLRENAGSWSVSLADFAAPQEAAALAVWVQSGPEPIQVVGGWIQP